MPARKPPPPIQSKTFRLRIEPYFAVKVVDDPNHRHETFLGRTAREALLRAKRRVIRPDVEDVVLVVNGQWLHAIGWTPVFPSTETEIMDAVLNITDGILIE